MNDLPKCPKCKMNIEVGRYWNGIEMDEYRNPIFTVYCGCPDCMDFITLKCIVSKMFVGNDAFNPTKKQEYWDSQYGLAVDQWNEKNKVGVNLGRRVKE